MSTRMHVVSMSVAVGLAVGAPALGQIVFQNNNDLGWFTPFNSSTAAGTRYGDAGWLGGPGAAPVFMTGIRMQLATFGGSPAGSTDITFRFHDGDPAGQFFGPGTVLYSTTITGVTLPASAAGTPSYFDLYVPLPLVATAGNFNNVGWSIGVENFSYGGSMGFGVASASAQIVGFSTFNASTFDGTSWSLFSFGGPANYVVEMTGVPTPGAAALLAVGGLAAARRRRR